MSSSIDIPGLTVTTDAKTRTITQNFANPLVIAAAAREQVRAGYPRYAAGGGFTAGWDRDKCLEACRAGWLEGVRRLTVGIDDIARAANYRTEMTIRHDFCGALVDVPAFLEGEPECMVDFVEHRTEGEVVEIILNGYFSVGIAQEHMVDRAIAVASLACAVVNAGMMLSLKILFSCRVSGGPFHGWNQQAFVAVHEPGDLVDLGVLAYWCGHPGAIRGILYFASQGMLQADNGRWDDEVQRKLDKEAQATGNVYVPGWCAGPTGWEQHWSTPEKCAAWVEGELNRVKQSRGLA
jgi:hypothetical protein